MPYSFHDLHPTFVVASVGDPDDFVSFYSYFSLSILLVLTVVFDILVFALTAWKLYFPRTKQTRLISQMLRDGLLYFLVM